MKDHPMLLLVFSVLLRPCFQAVPVPEDVVDDIKETFMGCALMQDFELHEIPKHSDLKQVIENIFYIFTESIVWKWAINPICG